MPTGTSDLDRPRRLALVALDVVGERGVEGLTHRAVASAANVPLGSTTYHFKTLDDLLAAAMVEAKAATDAEMAAWSATVGPETDLIHAIAQYVTELLEHQRSRTVVEVELYLAALRRPQLRQLADDWNRAFPAILEQHTDAETAQALALAFDGLLLHGLTQGAAYRIEDVERVLRRVAR